MLSNAYLLAKIGADTAENEQRFAEILPTDGGDEPPLRPRAGDGDERLLHLRRRGLPRHGHGLLPKLYKTLGM